MHRGEMLRLRRKAARARLYRARRNEALSMKPAQRKAMKFVGVCTKRCHLR